MVAILCVTCKRDWAEVELQLRSYKLFLPSHHHLIYVVEDHDHPEELAQRITQQIVALGIENNYSIVIGNDLIPICADGWNRQQLLKLLVSRSQDQIVWVIDSKVFLVRRPDDDLGHRVYVTFDQLSEYDPHVVALSHYSEKLGLPIPTTGLVSPVTPFEFDPVVVSSLIEHIERTDGDILEWWFDCDYRSEFHLYQIWANSLGLKTSDVIQRRIAFWQTNLPSISEFKRLLDDPRIIWVSKHREVDTIWTKDHWTIWFAFLQRHGLFP